ncbi:MAG: helix-turn-helix transcriptional regulator [Myxococcota bacterium]
MPTPIPSKTTLYGALLKHWRTRCGLSQMALSLESDVSSRHISFLETGRAQPGREMVLRLADALDVPLAEQNAMLRAAGFPEAFDEPSLPANSAIRLGIEHIKAHHEPYPLVVLDAAYNLVDANVGAMRLFQHVAPTVPLYPSMNTMKMFFEHDAMRSAVVHWEQVARALLGRLQLEVLQHPNDTRLSQLLNELLAFPTVPDAWRIPDFRLPSEPVFMLYLRCGTAQLGFITAVTLFSAPNNTAVQELRVESYFPLDETTRLVCQQLAAQP